jgi:flagellar biosynthesis protein FliR
MDLAKIVALAAQLKQVLMAIVEIVIPTGLLLVAVDLVFDTHIGVLQRTAALINMGTPQIIGYGLIIWVVYLLVNKK